MVPVKQSRAMAAKLQSLGHTPVLLEAPGSPHFAMNGPEPFPEQWCAHCPAPTESSWCQTAVSLCMLAVVTARVAKLCGFTHASDLTAAALLLVSGRLTALASGV